MCMCNMEIYITLMLYYKRDSTYVYYSDIDGIIIESVCN